MKDTIYFRHDFNAHSDPKIKKLRMRHGLEGYGFYWYVIELSRAEADGKLQVKELAEVLAFDLNLDLDKVKAMLKTMLESELLVHEGKGDDAKVYSPRLLRDIDHMHEHREKNRENGKKGGRPKTQTKPTGFENETQTKPMGLPNETQPKPNQKANSIVKESIEEDNKEKYKKEEDRTGQYTNEDGAPIFHFGKLYSRSNQKYYHLDTIGDNSMVRIALPGEQPVHIPLKDCKDADMQYVTDLVAIA